MKYINCSKDPKEIAKITGCDLIRVHVLLKQLKAIMLYAHMIGKTIHLRCINLSTCIILNPLYLQNCRFARNPFGYLSQLPAATEHHRHPFTGAFRWYIFEHYRCMPKCKIIRLCLLDINIYNVLP